MLAFNYLLFMRTLSRGMNKTSLNIELNTIPNSYLAFPTIFGYGGHLRSEAVRVKGTITNITEQKTVFVVRNAADLAPLTFLALPPCTDDSCDANLKACVEVMLRA